MNQSKLADIANKKLLNLGNPSPNELAKWKLNQMAKFYDRDGFGGSCDESESESESESEDMLGGRALSSYNKFFAAKRKQGLTAKEIGKLWRQKKGGVMVGGIKAKKLSPKQLKKLEKEYEIDINIDSPSMEEFEEIKAKAIKKSGSKSKKSGSKTKKRKMNPWVECERKLGQRKNKLSKRKQSLIWQRTKPNCSVPEYNAIVRKMQQKSGSKRKTNPWVECEKKLGKRKNKLSKKKQSLIWKRTKPNCSVPEYNAIVRKMMKK